MLSLIDASPGIFGSLLYLLKNNPTRDIIMPCVQQSMADSSSLP